MVNRPLSPCTQIYSYVRYNYVINRRRHICYLYVTALQNVTINGSMIHLGECNVCIASFVKQDFLDFPLKRRCWIPAKLPLDVW